MVNPLVLLTWGAGVAALQWAELVNVPWRQQLKLVLAWTRAVVQQWS